MGLDDLNEKIHGRDFHLDRMTESSPYDPAAIADADTLEKRQAFEKTESWQSNRMTEEALLSKQHQRKKILSFVLGGCALVALLGGIVFKVHALLYSEGNITLEITGPRQVASAESSDFTVVYGNKNWSAVENVSLIVSYPDSFQPETDSRMKISASQLEIPLGTINARTTGKATFSGKFYGAKGDTLYLKMRLRYSPSNVNSQFEKEEQYGVSIASSVLTIDMLAPQQSANDDIVEYAIDYANRSDKNVTNIRVKVEYPDQFTFVSSDPAPSEGNSVWYIGSFDPGKQGKILVRGRLVGARDEVKKVKAMIGYFGGGSEFVAYSSSEQLTRIVTPPLSITQTVNGRRDFNANAGEVLAYEIAYRNDGNIGLRDAIITVKLDSEILNYRELTQERGSYDALNRVLIWKASDIAALARLNPGSNGVVRFSIPVLNPIPASVDGKNFSIQTTAKIDSPDIPTPVGANKIIASNTLLTKVNSLVGIKYLLAENDSVFTGRGPIPPVSDQETIYTLKFRLTNEYNDITKAKLTLKLPSSSRYLKQFAPDTEAVSWNERTNELVWDLATYRATRGQSRELRFQVAVTPALGTVDTELQLVNSIVFTGTDQFTKQDVYIEHNAKDFRREDGSSVIMRVSLGNE